MTRIVQTRRAALATVGAALVATAFAAPAVAADDAAAVAAAVEALRVAMVAGDGKALAALVFDQLVYVHSDGHLDTKESFLKSLDGTNSFKSLALSDQIVDVVGDNALVRHTFDSVNNLPEGKTSTAHIRVLQVWKLDKGAWKLLARQSTPLKV
ncbi:nuclear transport factor 2 family protein [Siculibacillus lacustris]|uniref:Nuclear transport factor 2 family protein n=1 Tax=Siculibacillus lacustris TaxID=1549641 RepID=A0A4Q9VYA9_9HYPH|nr:nuclear transport factor 2 family protein [Siculibacillus lacustris]TBW40985.1 nuclear transport factor 2 family protein [Siculibacillus lacustris]